jgi:hypothetical protein
MSNVVMHAPCSLFHLEEELKYVAVSSMGLWQYLSLLRKDARAR